MKLNTEIRRHGEAGEERRKRQEMGAPSRFLTQILLFPLRVSVFSVSSLPAETPSP